MKKQYFYPILYAILAYFCTIAALSGFLGLPSLGSILFITLLSITLIYLYGFRIISWIGGSRLVNLIYGFLVFVVGCQATNSLGPNRIYSRAYLDKNSYLCKYYATTVDNEQYIYFEDSCSKYNIGDTIKH